MTKVSINAEDASNAFFNMVDVIKALKRIDGVLQTPISHDDDKEGYLIGHYEEGCLIGDCLDDIRAFLQKLDHICRQMGIKTIGGV